MAAKKSKKNEDKPVSELSVAAPAEPTAKAADTKVEAAGKAPRAAAPKKPSRKPADAPSVPAPAAPPADVETDPQDAPTAPIDRARVAARAFELWQLRGGPAFDNWIQAERDLGA